MCTKKLESSFIELPEDESFGNRSQHASAHCSFTAFQNIVFTNFDNQLASNLVSSGVIYLKEIFDLKSNKSDLTFGYTWQNNISSIQLAISGDAKNAFLYFTKKF